MPFSLPQLFPCPSFSWMLPKRREARQTAPAATHSEKRMSHYQERTDTLSASKLQLMQFPDELLAIICAHIGGSQYLCSLATVCRRLQHLAERLIYRSILIRSGGQAAALAHALDKRPARKPCIRQLTNACKSDCEDGMLKLVECMSGLANLTSLEIQSPENQNLAPDAAEIWVAHQHRYERMFQDATHLLISQDPCLQRLRSCKSISDLSLRKVLHSCCNHLILLHCCPHSD